MLVSIFRRLKNRVEGTTAIEYALVAALIAMAMVTSASVMGERAVAFFASTSAEFERIMNAS